MLIENITMALQALKANKMRSFLTMLGIIIGISSVIAIMTIGNALTAFIANELESLGTSNVMVTVRERSEAGQDPGGESASMNMPDDEDLITDEEIGEFKTRYAEKIDGVALSYMAGGVAAAKDGRLYANVSLTGVNCDYQNVNKVNLDIGRFISDQDVSAYRNVAVVSDRLVAKMFSDAVDPVGREVKIYGTDTIDVFTIIGVYRYEAGLFDSDDSVLPEDLRTDLYIPISTAKQTSDYKNHHTFTVKVKDDVDPVAFTEEINGYFKSSYVNNPEWDVTAENFTGMIDTINSTLNMVSVAISVIAGISLMVGGIGVMNIMLVSVTERTTEIGIRKALGAKNFHVRFQFIMEAGIISLLGGLIGIVLGLLIGGVVSLVAGTAVSVSPYIIMASICFSTVIGLFFGYYPANKAAQLDPIDALRYS